MSVASLFLCQKRTQVIHAVISFENHDLSLNTVHENRDFGWKIDKLPKSIAHPDMSMMA